MITISAGQDARVRGVAEAHAEGVRERAAGRGRPEAAMEEPARCVLRGALAGGDEASGEGDPPVAEGEAAELAVSVEGVERVLADAETRRPVPIERAAERGRQGAGEAAQRGRVALRGVDPGGAGTPTQLVRRGLRCRRGAGAERGQRSTRGKSARVSAPSFSRALDWWKRTVRMVSSRCSAIS